MRRATGIGALLGSMALAVLPTIGAQAADEDPATRLHLVALTPTTGQAAVLDRLGDVADPVYRWHAALNGFAVELTAPQARELAGLPGVTRVEPEEVRPVAGTPTRRLGPDAPSPGEGGRGTVIGFVDTGLHADTPAFADTPTLGPLPESWTGSCEVTDGWAGDDCSRKIVGAQHFVAGFGEDRLRSGAHLSAVDDDGHGTEVASLAAGNAEVSALRDGERLGRFSGAAPDARIAVYKACWSAPDPADDGCSTADVVTAIDRATADGVDVLNVSVAGSDEVDMVSLALLGATEDDVVVVGAAGNERHGAGHTQPWVLTVGAASGPTYEGVLRLAGGTELPGVLTSRDATSTATVVPAARIPAPGRSADDARRCLPGALDAGAAAGRLVLCDRGGTGRVDKSAAVALADGAGMVLANTRADQGLNADFHSVPTLHVSRATADELRAALRDGTVRGRLVPDRRPDGRARVLGWSGAGDPDAPVVKPDLVASGSGLLAASVPVDGEAWQLTTGTSAATALVSGYAARVRAAHPSWSVAEVRSALQGSAASAAGEPSSLRQGAGLPRPGRAVSASLVMDEEPGAQRAALESGDTSGLNTPSVLLPAPSSAVTVTREVTNTTGRHAYFSSSRWGFTRHRVQVSPAALRIPPGETRTFEITVTPRPGTARGTDSGWVAWRGADGSRLRLPVVLTAR